MLDNVEDLLERYLEERLAQLAVQGLNAIQPAVVAIYSLTGKLLWTSSPASARFPATFRPGSPWAEAVANIRSHGRGEALITELGPLYLSPIAILEGPIGFLAVAPVEAGAVLNRLQDAADICSAFLAEALTGRRTGADLAAELTSRYEELSLVYTITESMDLSKDEREAVAGIADAVASTLSADLLILMVPRLGYEFYYPLPDPTQDWGPLAQALFTELSNSPRTSAVNFLGDSQQFAQVAAPFSHVACAPIRVDADLGLLALLRKDPGDRLYMGEVKMLEAVSRQLSIFMTNRKIINARKQLFDLTIFGLARLAESRDVETGEHLERVSSYCRVVAEYCLAHEVFPGQLNREFVETIFSSSPLHDIGKVGIPDAILNKPGKLTPEEFEMMKLHSRIGGDTLRDIEERLNWGESTFLTMGREIAYSHHEKWDGSGYPEGLAGEQIPLSGRIMAVADVYDALTSKRCYKEAMPHEQARAILVEGSGKHFDSRLVEVFLACEEEFTKIATHYHGRGADQRERSRFMRQFGDYVEAGKA